MNSAYDMQTLTVERTSGAQPVEPDDMLEVPQPKKMFVQHRQNEDGKPELCLFYGASVISFDEAELIPFGEALARQVRFQAGSARSWAEEASWPQIAEALGQLVQEGILRHASETLDSGTAQFAREQPAPLPPATCPFPRSWREAEKITKELAGRSVEVGYLEVCVPIFRVGHTALDGDGRQVGEANVFPRPLRIEMPTTWLTCIYPGSRYMAPAPMNATALKAMRDYWGQMMCCLLHIREAFLKRCPSARDNWTVGDVERLSTVVLAVASFPVMKWNPSEKQRLLSPVLSSMFRVTDGLRTVMHQMLFVPVGEPTLMPETPITAAEIHDYAERNFSFYSDTGVCAGPKIMVQEFLKVILEGHKSEAYGAMVLDREVQAALDDVEAAMDYGLIGLQTYAVTFSLWPRMTQAFDQIANLCTDAVASGAEGFQFAAQEMGHHQNELRHSPFLAKEAWRADRQHVYEDMYRECGSLIVSEKDVETLQEVIGATDLNAHSDEAYRQILEILQERMCRTSSGLAHAEQLAEAILEFGLWTQGILRGAERTQARIGRLLGRPTPSRHLEAPDLDVYNRLAGKEGRKLPYLLDEFARVFGVNLTIDSHGMSVERA